MDDAQVMEPRHGDRHRHGDLERLWQRQSLRGHAIERHGVVRFQHQRRLAMFVQQFDGPQRAGDVQAVSQPVLVRKARNDRRGRPARPGADADALDGNGFFAAPPDPVEAAFTVLPQERGR